MYTDLSLSPYKVTESLKDYGETYVVEFFFSSWKKKEMFFNGLPGFRKALDYDFNTKNELCFEIGLLTDIIFYHKKERTGLFRVLINGVEYLCYKDLISDMTIKLEGKYQTQSDSLIQKSQSQDHKGINQDFEYQQYHKTKHDNLLDLWMFQNHPYIA